jgi:hypothetical protein
MVPLRALPVLAATVNATEPLPAPLAPAVTATHATLLVAVQSQPAAVVTATLPLPPGAAIEASGGAIVYVHGTGAAAWFTVNVWPAMVSVPVRALPVLAATVNATEPFPVPTAPAVTATHGTLLVAVQSQPAAVVTATLPLPPGAGIEASGGAIE